MDFQRLLLEVGKALCKDEVKALAFLCIDLLGQSLTSVESASDLFSRLADQDHLSPEQPHLLTELLLTIHRNRLVRDLNLTDPEFTTRSFISPYRKLLYNLSEEITDDDLKQLKFLLNKTLPRRKLEENVTTLEVFLEMEHMDLLSDTNLNELEKIIASVYPMLKEKINQFKARPAQETSRPMSMSYHPEPNQAPQALIVERTTSHERSALLFLSQCSQSSSNTSVDVPDECGALFSGLSVSSTQNSNSCHFKSDDFGFLPPKGNEASSKREMSQTTDTNNEVLGIYPMTSARRGICLIVNNYRFSKPSLKDRVGTMIDEKRLQVVFEWLGFQVEIRRDCTSKEMLSVLQELGRRDHKQVDCVVCCILSHGQEGGVYGVDSDTVKIRQLMEPLNGLKCSTLAGKPKLFFIQACQGTNEQKAVYVEADGPACDFVYSDAITAKDSIPSDADFLLAMATVPSFISFRDKKNGTWFIHSLCQNLLQMVPGGVDLVSILTKVNADVSQKTDKTGEKKQMPQIASSLRKKVVFPVPRASPPMLPSD
ncbi:caspase-8-like [Lates japonicus]